MNNAVEVTEAPCGCSQATLHRPKCRLVRSVDLQRELPHTEQGNEVRCDAEDGAVWLHAPSTLTPMTANRARHLGDELHVCAQSLEKPR